MARDPNYLHDRIRVEGNRGGDYLALTDFGSENVLLDMGHQCAVVVRKVVPVEFLVMVLTDAIDTHGGVEGAIRALGAKGGWNESYVDALCKRVRERTV